MKALEWTTVDKATWGPGPWQTEPDKAQWIDEATGLPCLIHRNGVGALCGYVGVPEGHSWHGKEYGAHVADACATDHDTGWCDCPRIDGTIEVHGGLTYADRCSPSTTPERGICHLVEPGDPDNVWWFGFDCAHAWDLCPGMYRYSPPSPDDVYRDVAYVRAECAGLARQLLRVTEVSHG